MSVDFKATTEELDLVHEIARRAVAQAATQHILVDFLGLTMDLLACHNQCPLDLARLAGAPIGDFVHDVFGIRHHLDRRTGELRDCFLPRFALPEKAEKGVDNKVSGL